MAKVYVVEADGGKPRRLTMGDFQETMPSWSRDGQWIYFTSDRGNGGNQVWKVPVLGGPPLQLTRNGGARPVESWDGRYIYYRRAASIWKMKSSGGEEFAVVTIGIRDLWDLADSGIYILDGSKTGPAIDLFSFETLTRRRVLALQGPAVDYFWGNGSLSVSPDHRWAVYEHKDREESSIMMASGFR